MTSNDRRWLWGLGTVAALAFVVGCAEPTPEVTPAPQDTSTSTEESMGDESADDNAEERDETSDEQDNELEDSEPEAEEPTTGSREAPLDLGETRKLADDSAFIVGITESNLDAFDVVVGQDPYHERPPDGEVFVLGTVLIEVDGEALERQGFDVADGVEPAFSVMVEFVGNEGRSYDDLSGTWCYTNNLLIETGSLYDDGSSVTGDVCISVPEDEVDGGLWRISNHQNDAVWIQGD